MRLNSIINERRMIIWQSVNAPPPSKKTKPTRPKSLAFVCADGLRRSHRCLTSSIPSITQVQTVQLEADVFFIRPFCIVSTVCLHQNKIKGWKIGSVWIDSNSSIDLSLLKHCSFILNATVWYCFCINTYLIMCNYVRLILISCSSLFTFSCYLVFLKLIVSALLHFAPHLSAYFPVVVLSWRSQSHYDVSTQRQSEGIWQQCLLSGASQRQVLEAVSIP